MATYRSLDIYSNDGSTLLATLDVFPNEDIAVTSSGFDSSMGDYTYSGTKKFLGFATSPNATTPTYAVGTTFQFDTASSAYTLYIVEGTATAITDLTNTTWVLNDTITAPPYSTSNNYWGWVEIEFKYNDINYGDTFCSDMQVSLDGNYLEYSDQYANDPTVYSFTNNTWNREDYRTITITGGSDATSLDLISWLEANGTLQGGSEPVTIKAGTYTWNETIPQSGWCSGTTVKGVRFNFKIETGGYAYSKYGFHYTNIDEETYTTSWQLSDTDWTINQLMGYWFESNRWNPNGGRTFTVETDQEVTGDDAQGFMDYLTANSDYGSQSEPEEPTDTITDLTGYTWVGNNTLVYKSFTYHIDFIADNKTYNMVSFSSIDYGDGNPVTQLLYGSDIAYSNGAWVSETYKNIQITGGTDATNADLIAWLQENGTLTAPAQPEQPEESTEDIKPVYKRVGGEWVKFTAFERINGVWVKISSAEVTVSTTSVVGNAVAGYAIVGL